MRRSTKAILAIVVCTVISIAYMAVIGFGVAIDDFTDPDGSGAFEPTEETIAYATFYTKVSMYLYPPNQDYYEIRGVVLTVTADVERYSSPDEGRVYDQETWDILSPVPPPIACGEVWVELTVTGPGDYTGSWASDRVTVYTMNTVATYAEWDSGRAFFTENGVYYVTVTEYGSLDGTGWENEKIASKTVSFEVRV